MNIEKFKSEYEWVLGVLKSCENKGHLLTCTKLYDRLIKKWSYELSESKIDAFNGIFYKLYLVQRYKIKKNVG